MKLYTKVNCPNCEEVKELIEDKEISIVDIDKDVNAMADMLINDFEELPILALDNGEFITEIDNIKSFIHGYNVK